MASVASSDTARVIGTGLARARDASFWTIFLVLADYELCWEGFSADGVRNHILFGFSPPRIKRMTHSSHNRP